MLTLNNIYKSYDKGKTFVIQNLNFEIQDGDFISVLGDSGVGKTTLINILSGIITPTKGTYIFQKKNVEKFSEKNLAEFRNKKVGVVFQNYNLFSDLSVKTNIILPVIISKGEKKEHENKVVELAETLGIRELLEKKPFQLSGGEQQRVAFARALINKPSFILADEPTGNLDVRNTKIIFDILKKLNESGITILVVTHNPDFAKLFSKTYLLNGKKMTKME